MSLFKGLVSPWSLRAKQALDPGITDMRFFISTGDLLFLFRGIYDGPSRPGQV